MKNNFNNRAFIRTFIKTNKYKNFFRHNFLIWNSTDSISEKINTMYITKNSMIYVSNWYLMLDIKNNFRNLDYNSHLAFINNFIKEKQNKDNKTWFKNILNIIKKNKEKLGIINVVEYIDEITLDYDSELSLLWKIDFKDISKYKIEKLLDLSNNHKIIESLIQQSIKKKTKIGNSFIGFKEHANYFLSILKNYNFLTADKIFITKYIDWSDLKNFQITFKIKKEALTKIMYNTLFNKITKGIYDKILKSAWQLKIYKVWENIKRQIEFFWQKINLKVKQYNLNNEDIKTIEGVSFRNIIIQNIRNKISDKIVLTNYKNIQYSLNNNLIYDSAIKNIFSITFFTREYYNWIINRTIPKYKHNIDQLIKNLDVITIEKLTEDIKKINNKIEIKNLLFIQSFSFIKSNQLNKIKLLKHLITNLSEAYKNITENNNKEINDKIVSLLNNITTIHIDFYKLLQHKYKKTKNRCESINKNYNITINNIQDKKIKTSLQQDGKPIKKYKDQIKLLVWILWNSFEEKDQKSYQSKIKRNKNIYYNYISLYSTKGDNLKYSYKKNLSFQLLSSHIYKIFDTKWFKNFNIQKHELIDFLINYLDKIEKRIIQKEQKENNFQNFLIFNKKKQNIHNFIKMLWQKKKGKDMLYNNKKTINFFKKNEPIIEEIFNITFKTEWKVSKSIFLIQKEFFTLVWKNKKDGNKKEFNSLNNEKKYYKEEYWSVIQSKVIKTIRDNYYRNYYEWNRFKFITWTFFYLKNKIEYYHKENNILWIKIIANIIDSIEQEIDISGFIEEHGNYIIEELKNSVPI